MSKLDQICLKSNLFQTLNSYKVVFRANLTIFFTCKTCQKYENHNFFFKNASVRMNCSWWSNLNLNKIAFETIWRCFFLTCSTAYRSKSRNPHFFTRNAFFWSNNNTIWLENNSYNFSSQFNWQLILDYLIGWFDQYIL